MMTQRLFAICLMMLFAACSSGTSTVAADLETDPGTDLAMEDSGSAEPDVMAVDLVALDTEEDLWVIDGGVDLGDVPWTPGQGEAGSPCESDDQCYDGPCIHTPDGKQCTIFCQDECPFDWECALHTPSLPDQVYFCAPVHLDLCRPCTQNSDCMLNSINAGQACLPYGGAGAFCGEFCHFDDDCPEGYSCEDTVDVPEQEVRQCVLQEGECGCAAWDIDSGASTWCFVENEFGQCEGERLCQGDGLTPCSAPEPALEECNGIDDDCDGEEDEETGGGECPVINSYGTCAGFEECDDGEIVCVGPAADPETCDGKDNDCDGQTDENFPDTDDDGVADCLEADKDGDGIADGIDNCPSDFNPQQQDHDLDGDGDACDQDDDNDQSADWLDCGPFDDEVYPGAEELCDGKDNDCNAIADEGFIDSDGDGWKNCIDEDDDNDQSPDPQDCAPEDPSVHPAAEEICDGADNDCDNQVDEGYPDLNEDGIADCADEDMDGDGIANQDDNCPKIGNEEQEDLDEDGTGDACDADMDGDAILNTVDNCPEQANTPQADLDSDGAGDKCDEDLDGDGFDNGTDNCPEVENPGQEDLDLDDAGDVCDEDLDGDGLDNSMDNCPATANEGQEDADLDSVGDACDNDADGDAIPDGIDNCPGITNPTQADSDNDGQGDPCDDDLDGDGFDNDKDNCPLVSNADQSDLDLDGVGDACEDDKDGDGTPDAQDCAPLDPNTWPGAEEKCDGTDNNCNLLVDEGFVDTDFDGLKDCVDGDDDNDGDADDADCGPLDGAISSNAAESCDGVDNNCNDLIDEELGILGCGKGECWHTLDACIDGVPQACDPLEGIAQETCDGLDNDCDGLADEDLGAKACGLGACYHTVPACLGGVDNSCDPLEGALDEVCDGQDNNCNGQVDEQLGTVTCGQGACLHTTPVCVGGVEQQCDPEEGAQPEVCDGQDNDCNGEIDDGLGTATCGKGPCEHTIDYCVDGKIQICNPFDGADVEACDGIDNDCDGLADEDLGFLSCGLGACAHTIAACVDGELQICDPLLGAAEETCNAKDDDCDGAVDEELGTTTCGLGECEHTEPGCIGGLENECDPLKGQADEECDGLDNDCDGTVDNGFDDFDNDELADCVDPDDDNDLDLDEDDCNDADPTVGPSQDEVCNNGVDNDCDGKADDDTDCLFVSCQAALDADAEAQDGVYWLDPDGDAGVDAFQVYCDMNGAWALVLKATGANTFWYGSGYWTNDTMLAQDDLTVDPGDSKYAAFMHVKVTTMRACLDGHCYSKSFNGTKAAREIFSGGADVVGGHPGFGSSNKWSTQPNCKHFGINTPYNYQQARFGYTANQEGDCSSNDTGIGLGLGPKGTPGDSSKKGAGYLCLSSNCNKGNITEGGNGFLWVK
jgi:hypothetical protein